jgi:two-component system, NarL family, sensor histidine kinase DesK
MNGEDCAARSRSERRTAVALGTIWLVFLVFPAVALARADVSTVHRTLALLAAGAFVVAYVGLLASPLRAAPTRASHAVSGLLAILAIGLTALDRSDWASLFIYTAAAGALVLPPRAAVMHVLVAAALAGTLTVAGHGGTGAVLSYTVSAAGIGFLLITVSQLRTRNLDLQRARNELAELAVARERERFARDLHDLLGHSLSVIALKAQLARRLIVTAPGEAERHLADLEDVARGSLTEVRDAVGGYRQPTLDDALSAARVALSAARIDAHFDVRSSVLAPQSEGVVAWAVREGTTNVIRHSDSRNCWIRVESGESQTAVEILDDGHPTVSVAAGGSGLRGLRERAAALAGAVESGARTEGGFRLLVTLPRGG